MFVVREPNMYKSYESAMTNFRIAIRKGIHFLTERFGPIGQLF